MNKILYLIVLEDEIDRITVTYPIAVYPTKERAQQGIDMMSKGQLIYIREINYFED